MQKSNTKTEKNDEQKAGVRKKLRVLMIGPDRSVHGGISGVVNNYYEAGLNQRIDLHYIGTMVEGTKGKKLLKAGISYVQFLRELPRYDIIHVNVASDNSFVRKSFFIKAANRKGKKIVIHQHGGDFEGYFAGLSERKKGKVKQILSMGNVVLVLAPAWKNFFGNLIRKEKIIVFPDCIQIPEKESKQYGKHKILFLGRICRKKGIKELLCAVQNLKKQDSFSDIELFLGGIFEDTELKEAVLKLPYVHFLGWINGIEKRKYLQECDVFVLPSYFEGQSIAILEAMAAASAIVASDTGGIPEMILDGETGILIKPKSTVSLEQGLKKVLENHALAKSLGENARKKVESEYSLEQNIERLMKIYEDL